MLDNVNLGNNLIVARVHTQDCWYIIFLFDWSVKMVSLVHLSISAPASQPVFARLFFVDHARLSSMVRQTILLFPTLPASDQLILSDPH